MRIIEKLCLDPAQRKVFETLLAETLDAKGTLDTVRGMFVCATMGHAVAVLEGLVGLAERGAITLLRSKNRFARPSAGMWMDCLVNFTIADTGCVCEVQIVHQQLLTVRSELGAHHSYGTYRSAGELLEWLGVEGLLGDRQAQKRAVLKAALRWLLGGRGEGGEEEEEEEERRATTMMLEGMPEDESELDDLVAKQTWGMGRAMPEAAWPRLEGVVLQE